MDFNVNNYNLRAVLPLYKCDHLQNKSDFWKLLKPLNQREDCRLSTLRFFFPYPFFFCILSVKGGGKKIAAPVQEKRTANKSVWRLMFVSSAHITAATQKWWHCDFFFFSPLLILSTCVASRPQQLKQQIEQEVLEKDLIIMDHSKLNAMLQRRCRSIFLLCHISHLRHKPSIVFDSACHDEEDLEWSVFTFWTCFFFSHPAPGTSHLHQGSAGTCVLPRWAWAAQWVPVRRTLLW